MKSLTGQAMAGLARSPSVLTEHISSKITNKYSKPAVAKAKLTYLYKYVFSIFIFSRVLGSMNATIYELRSPNILDPCYMHTIDKSEES